MSKSLNYFSSVINNSRIVEKCNFVYLILTCPILDNVEISDSTYNITDSCFDREENKKIDRNYYVLVL